MELNYLAILVATIAQFVVGAIWYSVLFGKLWGKIHGFNKLPKAVQQKMVKDITPFYGLQFLVTVVTSVALAILINNLPEWNVISLTLLLWLGFNVPVQASGAIFGGTEGKWLIPKILVQAGGSLACLLAGAHVLSLF